jgi:hypothetical protein
MGNSLRVVTIHIIMRPFKDNIASESTVKRVAEVCTFNPESVGAKRQRSIILAEAKEEHSLSVHRIEALRYERLANGAKRAGKKNGKERE